MKLLLRSGWDKSITFEQVLTGDNKSGDDDFIILTPPFHKLDDYISQKDHGSILISGQRGVGKSTAVFEALKSKTKEELLPVYISALVLEATEGKGNENDETKKFLNVLAIIKNMVKSLESELKEYPVTSRKTRIKIRNLINQLSYTQVYWKYQNNFSSSLGLNILGNIQTKFLQSISPKLDFEDKRAVEERFVKDGLTLEDIAKLFREILVELKSEKNSWWSKHGAEHKFPQKLVFIIDELDFYDDEDADSALILDALKRVKSLINLANALFIFIVGKKTYRASFENKYYTTFNERIFFYKPTGKHLSEFLDKVVKHNFSQIEKENWERFKWWLISQCGHNFFELIQLIRSNSKLEAKSRQSYLEVDDLSDIQSNLATIEYASDEIYRQYLNNPKKYHLNETLYDELSEVRDSFLTWVEQDQSETLIYLNTISSELDDVQNRLSIRRAKRSLLRYLAQLANISLPPDGTAKGIRFNWSELATGLFFPLARKGITGAVLPKEEEFVTIHNELVNEIAKMFPVETKRADYVDFFEYWKSYSDMFLLGNSIDLVKKVQKGLKEIETKSLPDRNTENIEDGFAALRSLRTIKNSLTKFSLGLVVKTEYGDFSKDELLNERLVFSNQPIPNKRFLSKVTVFPSLALKKYFYLRFTVKLSKDALFNILLRLNDPVGDEDQQSFYMLRLEGRDSLDPGTRDGVLLKKAGSGWGMVNNRYVGGPKRTQPEVEYDVVVEFTYPNLKFKKKLASKERFELIETLEVLDNIKYIGFANELNSAVVSNIELYTKTIKQLKKQWGS